MSKPSLLARIESIPHSSLQNTPPTVCANCDIRAWVRAPDLAPWSICPAEVRISATGCGAGEIKGLAVGLRMKERAIIKLRDAKVGIFPVKPTRNLVDHAEIIAERRDHRSIFRPERTGVRGSGDAEYDHAMKIYNEAIKKPELWRVEGVERIVFDTIHELPYVPDQDQAEKGLDFVQSFYVHVPSTNFPPIEDRTRSSEVVPDNDGEFLGAESVIEYYLLVTMLDGSMIQKPAGRAGFLPQPISVPPLEWPQSLQLVKPVPGIEADWFGFNHFHVPPCDQDANVEFRLRVSAVPTHFIQGQKIVLGFTLTRSGEGHEYPTVFNVDLHTPRDLDWRQSSLEAEYAEILRNKRSGINRYHRNDYMSGKMLMVKPIAQPEVERQKREERPSGTIKGHHMSRPPLQVGQGRYDFEKMDEDVKDFYEFSVELTVPYDALPNFESTFQSFHPRLHFSLSTAYQCETSLGADMQPEQRGIPDLNSSDKDWVEAELPVRQAIGFKRRPNVRMAPSRSGSVAVNISPATALTSAMSDESGATINHYTDKASKAPVISLTETKLINFAEVNHAIRTEQSAEQLTSRYFGSDDNMMMRGHGENPGGSDLHAAKVWQHKKIVLNRHE